MFTVETNRQAGLRAFTQTYQNALKQAAPVRTGRLRDSIVVESSGISDAFDIVTYAVEYAIYVNNKTHFIDNQDYLIEVYANNYADDLWDDFWTQYNETS